MPLKDSFSKIAKSVEDGAKSVAKKSGGMVELTKLGREVSAEEEKIKRLYYELGKLFYEKYAKQEVQDNDVNNILLQIEQSYKNIQETKEKIAILKGLKICPNCREELEPKIAYCPVCGTKQEMPKEEEVADVQEIKDNSEADNEQNEVTNNQSSEE